MFFKILIAEVVEHYIWSYIQDLVRGVSRGNYITAKHTLLANVLHSPTGQEIPVDSISTFENCGNYNCSGRTY